MKRFIKTLVWLVFGLLVVLLVEFGFFYRVLTRPAQVEKSDVLVVFGGSEDRLRWGYELGNEGIADFMIVSPSDTGRLQRWNDKYHLKTKIKHLQEPRAETTLQNAVLSARIITDNKFKAVMLVTNRYHTPRSYFLLRMALAGKEGGILICPVEPKAFGKWPWAWSTTDKKRVYNEMIEFWGSMFEYGAYALSGELPKRNPQKNVVVSFLRRALLFEV